MTTTEPAPLRWQNVVCAALVSVAAFFLFGLLWPIPGYLALAAGLTGAWFADRELFKDLLLVGIGIGIVSTTSVVADVHWGAFFRIGTVLTLAFVVPFVIDRFVYKRGFIRFTWLGAKRWGRFEVIYLCAVPLLAYLILPFYFIRSGAYLNWPHITDTSELVRFLVGVNFVGSWDEFFFILSCFALLRRHFPVWLANLLQAVIFVSFLWELGYRVWGPLLTFPFALVQGWLYTKTGSLLYVLVVHLTFDVVVFLAIVHAHNPDMFAIFLVRP